jgi:hypothetical protein
MSTGVSQEDAVTELLKAGVQLVVVTAGADGATAYTASEEVRVAARQVAVVDTVGAGDSFHGGILAWLHTAGRLDNNTIGKLSTAELAEMLAYAASVSAITCSRGRRMRVKTPPSPGSPLRGEYSSCSRGCRQTRLLRGSCRCARRFRIRTGAPLRLPPSYLPVRQGR